jgi:hypothetical protein
MATLSPIRFHLNLSCPSVYRTEHVSFGDRTLRARAVRKILLGPLSFLLLAFAVAVAPLAAQEPEETRGAPAEPADSAEIRTQMSTAENLLGKTPDRGAILYFLAASHALLRETFPALDRLKECVALKEGFDPSGDSVFAELKTSADFQRLVAEVHKDFPAVHQSRLAFTTTEKDLFPEGLAYDAGNDSFYLGSIRHRKIVKIPVEGKVEDFVPAGPNNLLPIQGIRLDPTDATVWSASSKDDVGKSELLHFDRAGKLLGRFPPAEEGKHDFNDLVVLHGGDVALTDTLANKVYRFGRTAHVFTPLSVSRAMLSPNGIALSDDEQFLYVADQFGVLRIDLRSGANAEVDPGRHNTLAGIDGLYWHKGSLIAVQNGIGTPRVVAFRLSTDGLHVTKTTVLENFLKTPTTGALRGDEFFYIVNTQIDNLNGEHILDPTKLQPVRIAVVRLP